MRGTTTSRIGPVAFVLALAALLAVPAVAADADIQRRIEERFTKAGLDQETDITIEVQDEVVRLTGIALTLRDAREAERSARKVAKVVINEIRVFPEKTRSDRAIQKDAEKAIYTYSRYGAFDAVGVTVEKGVVTMLGFVRDGLRRREIEDRVARVEGVRDVHNDVRLQGLSPHDERLRLQIYARIYGDPLFQQYANWIDPPVRVFVHRGHVTLAGRVNSRVEQTALGFMAQESLAFSVQNLVQLESDVPEEDRPRDEG
jgi:osmotically-inducible protein OsmY